MIYMLPHLALGYMNKIDEAMQLFHQKSLTLEENHRLCVLATELNLTIEDIIEYDRLMEQHKSQDTFIPFYINN